MFFMNRFPMSESIKYLRYVLVLGFFAAGPFLFNSFAHAQSCDVTGDSAPIIVDIVCPIIRFVNIAIILGGVVFSFIIVFAAYKFYTSMGDPKGVQGARNTLTYGLLGFLLVIGSFAIVVLIVNILGITGGGINPLNPVGELRQGICDLVRGGATDGVPIVDIGCTASWE